MRLALVAIASVGVLVVLALLLVPGPWLRASGEFLQHPVESYRLYGLMGRFEAAAERKDPDAMAALVHEDAEHRGLTSGRLVQGREALRALFEKELAGESGTDEMEIRLVSLRFVTPRVAIGDLTLVYEDYRRGDRVWPVYREHTFVVASKRDGTWRLAASSGGGHDAGAAP